MNAQDLLNTTPAAGIEDQQDMDDCISDQLARQRIMEVTE